MATQLEDDDLHDDQEGVIDEQDNEPVDGDESEDEGEEDEEAASGDDDEDEDVITFAGAEQRGEDEPEHIRDLRRRYREKVKENEELRAAAAPKAEEIGVEPKMDDYWESDDPDTAFKADLAAYNKRKADADARKKAEDEQREAAQREWEDDLGQFETQRGSLKVRDFDAAYDRVTGTLSEVQQAILVQATTNKAALAYALGKNPDKLAEIAQIKSPVKFTAAIARLDMETKVQRSGTKPPPEGVVRGSGASTGRGDAKLERLEAEARKGQDRSKLIAYKKERGLL